MYWLFDIYLTTGLIILQLTSECIRTLYNICLVCDKSQVRHYKGRSPCRIIRLLDFPAVKAKMCPVTE